MDPNDLPEKSAKLMQGILNVSRFRKLLEDNDGDLDLTLSIRNFSWCGAYDVRATGNLSKAKSKPS